MLNQTAIVLVIGLVAVLMTLASTRVFAQPTLPPSQIETPADQHHAIVSEGSHSSILSAEKEAIPSADQHHAIVSEGSHSSILSAEKEAIPSADQHHAIVSEGSHSSIP
jgi:hypothetical protein